MKQYLKTLVPQRARNIYSNYNRYGLINPSMREIYLIESFNFFQRKGCLFIHIPKTAGISLYEGLFNRDSFGHYTIKEYINKFGKKKLDNIYKCCVVRNPYERAFSAYYYLIKGGRGKDIDFLYQKTLLQYSNFNDFVKNGLIEGQVEEIEHFAPQTNMITDNHGKITIDYLGRYENLRDCYNHISLKVNGYLSPIPIRNKNTSKEQRNAYSIEREVINLLSEYYERDFDLLGYKKQLI